WQVCRAQRGAARSGRQLGRLGRLPAGRRRAGRRLAMAGAAAVPPTQEGAAMRPFALGLLVLASGCGPAPSELAATLAARDATLAGRLAPAPDTWKLDGGRFTSPGWRAAEMGPFFDLGVRLPARANAPLELGIGQSPDYLIRLEPEEARPARGEDHLGRV